MSGNKKGRTWMWLVVVIVAGLSIYLYTKMGRKGEKSPPITKTATVAEKSTSPAPQKVAEETESPLQSTIKVPPVQPAPQEDPCAQIERNMAEFFRYLDNKKYVKQLHLQTDTYAHFRRMLRRCAAKPPIPAGEGADLKIIVRNLYHFFRVLEGQDLALIKEILKNEHETIEVILEMFYKWLTLGSLCPDPEHLRPSIDILYQYAGFFLNTTGGRAYLFRRPSDIRLMFSYYCALILHDADKKGKNIDGIDIFPMVTLLKDEIGYYSDFQFQEEYIEQLGEIESYYRQKR